MTMRWSARMPLLLGALHDVPVGDRLEHGALVARLARDDQLGAVPGEPAGAVRRTGRGLGGEAEPADELAGGVLQPGLGDRRAVVAVRPPLLGDQPVEGVGELLRVGARGHVPADGDAPDLARARARREAGWGRGGRRAGRPRSRARSRRRRPPSPSPGPRSICGPRARPRGPRRRPAGRPRTRRTSASPGRWGGAPRGHGYLVAASRAARVRLRPTLTSSPLAGIAARTASAPGGSAGAATARCPRSRRSPWRTR